MDASYNINGGFKPTLKRFADLDGPDFFPTPAWATYALIDNERFAARSLDRDRVLLRTSGVRRSGADGRRRVGRDGTPRRCGW